MKKAFFSHSRFDQEIFYMLSSMLEDEGIIIVHPDSLLSGDEWRSEILSAIRTSDVFIAIMDDLSPNVLLELGYAIGVGKNVLLLRSKRTKIPFDIASLPVKTIDRFDSTTAGEIAEWISNVNVREKLVESYSTAGELFKAILNDPELVDGILPLEFEQKVAEYFEELGFKVEHVDDSNDQGFDIQLTDTKSGMRIAVEVKKYNMNSRVSVREVQRIVGAVVAGNLSAAMIVTSGGFTPSAHYFAENSPVPVILVTLDDLMSWSREKLVSVYAKRNRQARFKW